MSDRPSTANWRTFGSPSPAAWATVVENAGGPEELASRECCAAAGPHGWLCLAMLGEESNFAQAFRLNTPANRNPLNLRPRGGLPGYLAFDRFEDGIREWRDRLTDPLYAYADTVTLADLVGVYAPASDSNRPAEYVANILARFARWGVKPKEGSMSGLVFGQVKHPPFVDRYIPNSQNGAWNDLGQRHPIGVCQHTMVGTLTGTDLWFRRGAESTGLTDYGVGLDGLTYRWNDPRGRRAGWANGGSDGLEGDGPLFVRTLGIDAINRDLVSIERDDRGDPYTTPFEGAQFEACAQLTAYWFDQAEVPWSSFPVNPHFGVVTHMIHLEFATKGCPHDPVITKVDAFQNRIRAILKAAQTATAGQPTEKPPVPIEQDHGKWPNGWTEELLAARFRRPVHVQLDGTEKRAGFNARGPLSNAWVARAVKEGITKIGDIPRPVRIVDVAEPDSGLVSSMAVFDGKGSDNWAIYRPAAHVAWRWIQ